MNKDKHPLDKIVWGVLPIVNYRNCYVTKHLDTGLYSLWNHSQITKEDVDRYIDESLDVIDKSIKQ